MENNQKRKGLPRGFSGKESTCQCKRFRLELLSRKIPHATEQQSPCATSTEPMLWSLGTSITGPCAAIIEDLMPKARSSKQEKPLQ